MERILNEIETIVSQTQDFAEAKIESAKLETVQKSVEVASQLVTWLVIYLLAFITIFTTSVVVGLILSDLNESFVIGFSYVGGFYLIILAILIYFRDKIISNPVKDILYGKFLATQNPLENDEH